MLFLTRGKNDRANTKGVWVYDLRANMRSFGKTHPLTAADFAPFEAVFGKSPLGTSPRVDEGEEGRFRFFSRAEISDRSDTLDITWLRDTSVDPEDEITEPEELAAAIAGHLRSALEEIEALGDELSVDSSELVV